MTRKAPKESATNFSVGTKKKGLDGNMYVVKQFSNSQRWVKLQTQPKGKVYYIHANGGRPFKVIITKDEVYVYEEKEIGEYSFYKKYSPDKVYIGKSKKGDHRPSESKMFDGNTILLQFGKNKFISIQGKIVQFSLPAGDKPIKYYSLVGHSDVPYPVLEGKNNIYFLEYSSNFTYLPKSLFPKNIKNFENAYDYYYENDLKKVSKKLKIKKIN